MNTVLVIAVAVLVVGCKKSPERDLDKEEQTKLEKELVDAKHLGPGASIKPEPLRSAATTPGPAYLTLSQGGLVKLDGSGAVAIEPPEAISEFATNRTTGELYARSEKAVYKVSDATFERLAALEPVSYERMAIAPEGRIWLVAPSTSRYWTGTEWKNAGKPFREGEHNSVQSIAIDGRGRVYASSETMIVVSDQDGWKTVFDFRDVHIQGLYPTPTSWRLVIAPAGELYAVIPSGLVKFDGKTVTPQLRSHKLHGSSGQAALHGTTIVTMSKDYILRWPMPDGEDVVTKHDIAEPLGQPQVMDGNGRVWSAVSTGGFSVVDDKGVVTYFRAGTIPQITSVVSTIAVAGGGPTLPTPGAVAKGSIRGSMTNKGKPVANAPIEVCQELRAEFSKDDTPCWNQRKYEGKTGADGTFEIKDLPLLDYGVAVQVGDQWYGIRGKACSGLQAGMVCDLGQLAIEATAK